MKINKDLENKLEELATEYRDTNSPEKRYNIELTTMLLIYNIEGTNTKEASRLYNYYTEKRDIPYPYSLLARRML